MIEVTYEKGAQTVAEMLCYYLQSKAEALWVVCCEHLSVMGSGSEHVIKVFKC